MLDLGMGEAITKLFWTALILLALGLTWLVFTVRYIIQDVRLAKAKRLKGAGLRVFLFWFHWVVGFVFALLTIGIPFLIASIGMRGLRTWGWPLAIASHSILFALLLWSIVSNPIPETASQYYWAVSIALLIVHLLGAWACIVQLRGQSSWRARFDQA